MAITIRDDYERSSVNLTGSSVSGVGDAAVISIKPRVQESETVSSQTRWRDPSARIDEVSGIRPTFRFLDYAPTSSDGTFHQAPWPATRKPMFSYDRETWHYFDNVTITSTYVEFRHDTAFTADTIYIGKSRQISVEQIGAWLDALAVAHPTIVGPSPAAAAFTPTLTTWSGQPFIADEFSSQLNELGATIPATPFYAALLDDPSIPPGSGSKDIALVYGGVHAGEDHANYAMMEFIEHFLGSSADAIKLRRHYKILLYPMLNAPGRAGGGWRGSFTQGTGGIDDLNRHFSDASPGLEIVTIPRTVIVSDVGAATPHWCIDFHGKIDYQWGGFFDGGSLHTQFQTRLATNSGFTVSDVGDEVAGFTTIHARSTLGATLAVTLEHGDPSPVTDANLATWGAAITETLESMRADELLGNGFAAGQYSVIYPSGQADPTAAEIIAGTVPNGYFSLDTLPLTDQSPFSSSVIANLTEGTSYKGASVWYDGTNTSNVVVSAAAVLPIPETYAANASAALSLTDAWALNYSETYTTGAAAVLTLTESYGAAYAETYVANASAALALVDAWALNYAETYATGAAAALTLTESYGAAYAETYATSAAGALTLTDSYAVGNDYVESYAVTALAVVTLTESYSAQYAETYATTAAAALSLADVWALNYAERLAATAAAELALAHTFDTPAPGAFDETFAASAVAALTLAHTFTTPNALPAGIASATLTRVGGAYAITPRG